VSVGERGSGKPCHRRYMQVTCFTGTKVQILTLEKLGLAACADASSTPTDTELQEWNVTNQTGTYADVCWRVLTYAGVCWRMLAYAGVCWRVLAYAGVCWRMLVCANVTNQTGAGGTEGLLVSTHRGWCLTVLMSCEASRREWAGDCSGMR
jgi:hypothetical protein